MVTVRLRKTQKEAVLKWIAAGLQSDEINALAAELDPPFEVSRRQVSYYRNTRNMLMEKDLLGGFLWLDQVKGIGSGDVAQIVDYEEFNKGEVDAYRGVLDDIAKEMGHRVQRQEVSGPGGGAIDVHDSRFDAALEKVFGVEEEA